MAWAADGKLGAVAAVIAVSITAIATEVEAEARPGWPGRRRRWRGHRWRGAEIAIDSRSAIVAVVARVARGELGARATIVAIAIARESTGVDTI